MVSNPILAREFRARWRDKRSFILLFLTTAGLVGLILWLYYRDDAWIYGDELEDWADMNTWVRVGRFSRTLFSALAMGNVAACFLISPALTAGGLAGERERGLLEGLWLSRLPMRSFVLGRFAAALAYLLIIELAVLPLFCLCLVLGSVSPKEIALAFLIAVCAGIIGLAQGLWMSAGAHRPSGAIISAYVIWFLWCALTLTTPALATSSPKFQLTTLYVGCFHPGFAVHALVSPAEILDNFYFSPGLGINFESIILVSCGVQVLLTLLLLALAVRRAARALPPPRWLVAKNPRLERWKKNLQERRRAAENQGTKRVSQEVEGALLKEIPVNKLVNFRNPLLQREVRSRFRFRQVGWPLKIARIVLLLVAAGIWTVALMCVTVRVTRSTAFDLIFSTVPYVLIPTIAIYAAQSLTREHEGGTWEGIRLSLMRDGEIVRSKWLAPLATCGYWVGPFFLLLPCCLGMDPPRSDTFVGPIGIRLPMIVALVGSWAAFASALGLLFSWRCKTTASATCWTLGILMCLLVVSPQFDVSGSIARFFYTPDDTGTNWQAGPLEYWSNSQALNPLMLLDILRSPDWPYPAYNRFLWDDGPPPPIFWDLSLNLLLAWTATVGCLLYVHRQLKRQIGYEQRPKWYHYQPMNRKGAPAEG